MADNKQSLLEEFFALRNSIDKAWNTGLDDKEAAEVLDVLVDRYRDIVQSMMDGGDEELTKIKKAINLASVLAMKSWDGIVSRMAEETEKVVKRTDLPADLTPAVRKYIDAEAKRQEAINFSKNEDIKGLPLYEAAYELYKAASNEVLLIEQGTKGLVLAQHEKDKIDTTGIILKKWQLTVGITGVIVAILLAIISILCRK